MKQETVFINSLETVNGSLYSLISFSLVSALKEKLSKIKALNNLQIEGIDLKKGIVITTNRDGKECIEIDVNKMELNRFYFGRYKDENYLYRKTSKNILESYEVY